jgi:predicted nucleic acid-binding protein
MKALIDTNVILDAIMGRAPYHTAAEAIILLAAAEKIQACITASGITDIYYILRKHMGDGEQAKQAVRKLMAIVAVLDVTGADCEKALELSLPDYEDALKAQCAKRNKVDCIITRDKRHFEHSPVRAVMPDDFLRDAQ